jgi:4'-phosphopantetheinyl transferase
VVEVEVWWGRPGSELPWHVALLDGVERERRSAFRRAEDKARFTVATAVLKLVVARRVGVPAERVGIDRTCEDCGRPHGRPRLPGTGLAASISHSGDRVAVALTGSVPVGVDVEQVRPIGIAEMAGHVLAADESAATLAEFFCYWSRKEAMIKATGDGLRMPLPKVVVTGPQDPPRLLRYGDRTDLVASLSDLDPGDGYAAAVAVLAAGPVRVEPYDASTLLAAPP